MTWGEWIESSYSQNSSFTWKIDSSFGNRIIAFDGNSDYSPTLEGASILDTDIIIESGHYTLYIVNTNEEPEMP